MNSSHCSCGIPLREGASFCARCGAARATGRRKGSAGPIFAAVIWLLAAVGYYALLPKVVRVGADSLLTVSVPTKKPEALPPPVPAAIRLTGQVVSAVPQGNNYLSLSLATSTGDTIWVWCTGRSTKIYERAAETDWGQLQPGRRVAVEGSWQTMEGERQLAAQRIDLLPVSAAGGKEKPRIDREARVDRIAKLSRHVHDEEGDFVDYDRKQSLSEGPSGQFQTDVRGRRRALLLHPPSETEPAFVELDAHVSTGEEVLVVEWVSARNDCGDESDYEGASPGSRSPGRGPCPEFSGRLLQRRLDAPALPPVPVCRADDSTAV